MGTSQKALLFGLRGQGAKLPQAASVWAGLYII